MILPDVNVLVAAFREDADGHRGVRAWLEDRLSSEQLVALSAASIVGFVRIVTHPRVFSPPSQLDEAIAFVDAMLESDRCVIAPVNERHWVVLREQLAAGDARGNLVPDADLAALAVQHGATLATRDRGFGRFAGVRLVDPLGDG